ncbi:hypothetical protein ACM46_09970 [Chryseobacterium angstadtii]|uniref:Uncharacterized protein n=1 Tax=Chryseobacterium angstadtii TaxID=558151 RepID=A0A0J7L687_9FLAO|nr:BfmA/BtgA family mobilization protein [Chryseobacterium angstadtii]KMQ64575.1 hypothetical protein ACM46_09970 [Chryseobacterium angstadtii]
MVEKDTNSIRYPKETDVKMDKLAKSLRRSKKEVFCQMVDYFYRSTKDPSDPGDEMLKRELSSGISRILSFIRQQEKDFFLPLFTDVGTLKTISSEHKKLLEGVARHILAESEKAAIIDKRSENLMSGIKLVLSKQKEKDVLKQQFSEVLEYYIAQREEMGWTTTAVKKEELMTHVRQSLKNL